MPTVAIPYVPMPADQSPNISRRADPSDVYLKAAFVALASFGRWNPSWSRVLLMPAIPSDEWVARFQSIGVRIDVLPFEHEPPPGFVPTFAGSFYLLDAVARFSLDEYLLLLDPDVLCIREVTVVGEMQDSPAALAIHSSPTEVINGLALSSASNIHAALGEERSTVVHYGGEFYGLPVAVREEVGRRMKRAWDHSLDAFGSSRPFFTTEEHVMSFALAGTRVSESSDLIRRIWTAHGYRTVTGRENELSLWHLPAEKERSFAILYDVARDPRSWFWSAPENEFITRCGLLAGLHGRSVKRLAIDAVAKVLRGPVLKTKAKRASRGAAGSGDHRP